MANTVPLAFGRSAARQETEKLAGLAALPCPPGGVAERSNAAVSKTVRGGFVPREFESLPLRFQSRNLSSGEGLRAVVATTLTKARGAQRRLGTS